MSNQYLFNKDFLDNNLNNNSIDLIITDPPFGVDLKNKDQFDDSKNYVFNNIGSWISEIKRVLKENSHCYIYVPVTEVDKWVFNVKKLLRYNNILVSPNFSKERYLKNNFCFDFQLIIYASNGKAKNFNKIDWIKTSQSWLKDKRNKNPYPFTYKYPAFLKDYRANVKSNKQRKLFHVCEKNTLLIEKLILLSSNENDIILDPFTGSGSTLVSAKNLNRGFIGYENNYRTYLIAKNRIEGDLYD